MDWVWGRVVILFWFLVVVAWLVGFVVISVLRVDNGQVELDLESTG